MRRANPISTAPKNAPMTADTAMTIRVSLRVLFLTGPRDAPKLTDYLADGADAEGPSGDFSSDPTGTAWVSGHCYRTSR